MSALGLIRHKCDDAACIVDDALFIVGHGFSIVAMLWGMMLMLRFVWRCLL